MPAVIANVTLAELVVTVLSNASWIVTFGCVVHATPPVPPPGCCVNRNFAAAPAVTLTEAVPVLVSSATAFTVMVWLGDRLEGHAVGERVHAVVGRDERVVGGKDRRIRVGRHEVHGAEVAGDGAARLVLRRDRHRERRAGGRARRGGDAERGQGNTVIAALGADRAVHELEHRGDRCRCRYRSERSMSLQLVADSSTVGELAHAGLGVAPSVALHVVAIDRLRRRVW